MLLIDVDTGLFAWTRPHTVRVDFDDYGEPIFEERPGTLLTQLWVPVDYATAPFGGDLEDDDGRIVAIAMAWVLDDAGVEQELEIAPDDFDQTRAVGEEVLGADSPAAFPEELAIRLVGLEQLPEDTPEGIRAAIKVRRQKRRQQIKGVIAAVERASEDGNLWLRLFGGDAVAGSFEGLTEYGSTVVLGKSRPIRGKPRPIRGDKNAPRYVPISEIAAASSFTGKWKRPPAKLDNPLFWRLDNKMPASLATPPQLWEAICPICGEIVRIPWCSGPCRSCREGVIRNQYSFLTTSRLLELLKTRAEWQKLVVRVEETEAGSWEAAFKTPDGVYVAADNWVEPLKMAVEDTDRREAIIKLTQLADDAYFSLNPDFEGRGSWKPIPETAP